VSKGPETICCLRGHGFPDVTHGERWSDQLDDALQACFINDACGRGMTVPRIDIVFPLGW